MRVSIRTAEGVFADSEQSQVDRVRVEPSKRTARPPEVLIGADGLSQFGEVRSFCLRLDRKEARYLVARLNQFLATDYTKVQR